LVKACLFVAQVQSARVRPPLLPSLGLSRGAILVAAAAFGLGDPGKSIDGRPGIGVRIEPAATFGAEAAPLAGEQGATEQVGPDLEAIEAPFITVGPDSNQGGRFREERQLIGDGRAGAVLRRLGMNSREMCHFRRIRTS
jgi:hypothetical protein